MTDQGRQAAIDAVTAILAATPDDMDARTWAVACVNAAEAVWPHDPPKRSPESAAGGQFTIRNTPDQPQQRTRLDGLGFMANPVHLLDSEEPHG